MGKVILAIDDSITIRDMLTFTLESAGYTVVTACDGEDGLDKLENNRFDVIITDMNMPKINGKEFLDKLRNKPSLNKNPVLVLTTEKKPSQNEIDNIGAEGWLVKPFNDQRLIDAVEQLIKNNSVGKRDRE